MAAVIRLATGLRLQAVPAGYDGPFIWYANHSSHLDFVALWAVLPDAWRCRTSPVAAKDYWGRGPMRRRLAERVFRAVLITRSERPGKDENPLVLMGDVLAGGRSLLIFPEGTRGVGGEVGKFRSGIYHLARRFPDVPLVPVYLENLNRILPKGSFLPVPLIARLAFHEPIFLKPDESKEAFMERARNALIHSHEHR
jgi:1-acyl-sn-glycerol-3-phosphate acyltransferase